jgi:cytochrome c553
MRLTVAARSLGRESAILLAVQQIQQALAEARFDEAAAPAERRLGMSPMAGLAELTATCVACHSAYRLE